MIQKHSDGTTYLAPPADTAKKLSDAIQVVSAICYLLDSGVEISPPDLKDAIDSVSRLLLSARTDVLMGMTRPSGLADV
jgi:hypothetical protein